MPFKLHQATIASGAPPQPPWGKGEWGEGNYTQQPAKTIAIGTIFFLWVCLLERDDQNDKIDPLENQWYILQIGPC